MEQLELFKNNEVDQFNKIEKSKNKSKEDDITVDSRNKFVEKVKNNKDKNIDQLFKEFNLT